MTILGVFKFFVNSIRARILSHVTRKKEVATKKKRKRIEKTQDDKILTLGLRAALIPQLMF